MKQRTLLLLAAAAAFGAPANAQINDVFLLDEKNERIYRMIDLDGDNFFLSQGEVSVFLSTDTDQLPTNDSDIEAQSIRFENSEPVWYLVNNSTGPGTSLEGVYRATDSNGNGQLDANELTEFFGATSINSEGIAALDNGDVWFSSDFSSSEGLWVLADGNADDDALDTNEGAKVVVGDDNTPITVDTDNGAATGTIFTQDFDAMTADGNGVVVYEGFSSACLTSEDSLFRFEDIDGDKVLDAGEARLWLNYTGKNATLPQNPDFASGLLPRAQLQQTTTSCDGVTQTPFNYRLRGVTSRIEGPVRAFYLASDTGGSVGGPNVDGIETEGLIFRAVDANADGDVNDAGEVTLWYNGSPSTSAQPTGQIFSIYAGQDGIYVVDNQSRISRLRDLDASGDAMGLGEQDMGVWDWTIWQTINGGAPIVYDSVNFSGPFLSNVTALPAGTLPQPAPNFTTSGTACSQYGYDPVIAGTGSAIIGTSNFTAQVKNIPGSVPCVLFVGTSTQFFAGSVPLPLELTFVGLPGCFLYQSNEYSFGAVSVGTPALGATDGVASIPAALPNNPNLVGFALPMQWLVLNIFDLDPNNLPKLALTGLGQVTIE